MSYDDQEYLKASQDLANAIYTLVNNEISKEDIQEMVDTAWDEAQPE